MIKSKSNIKVNNFREPWKEKKHFNRNKDKKLYIINKLAHV